MIKINEFDVINEDAVNENVKNDINVHAAIKKLNVLIVISLRVH